jgi:cobalt-zinc-cadmium resistance protein CzcA
MVRKLVEWALDNPLIVILVAFALVLFGAYSFWHVNVEAYPDPAPPIVEVVALYPGASAEEIERQVTIPLEVAFAGMPGLKNVRSQSLFGLSFLRMQWNYGHEYKDARQEVLNRLPGAQQQLPSGVTTQISPESPTGEIYRYTLRTPKTEDGKEIYTLNDLKALQDWVLEREFRTVPRIVDITSFGGTVRRYEVHPDPDRLKRYGITLAQLQQALINSNQTVGGDIVSQGHVALTVRSVGLFGSGEDPVRKVLGFEKQELEAFENQLLEGVVLGKSAADALRQRIQSALVGRKVEPPLTDEERRQAQAIERMRAGLAGRKLSPPLTEAEHGQVGDVQRIRAGVAGRKTDPPLTDDEEKRVETIDRRAALRARAVLRSEEQRRIREIRNLVIASVNNQPILVDHVVEGGPVSSGEFRSQPQGVVVSNQTRLGRVGQFSAKVRPAGAALSDVFPDGQPVGRDEPDKVSCIVLLRKGEDSLPALADVKAKVEELNDPQSGRMLPGVRIEPYYDRTDLIHVTTETVTENLLVGIVLVTLILFMFLNNVRTALIVAINIPLALLFAFSVLFLRGKSANLLSIGAVDFGIIVDSSVIMVENVYRHVSAGEHAELPLKERILRAVQEIDRALLFSTLIMVCAFIPLFTMQGPEGQLFGPMSQTYAFSLGGALILALMLSPVLCLFFFRHLKPSQENALVRFLKSSYLRNLDLCLRFRWVTVGVMAALVAGTGGLLLFVGREFMPELEEGNLWIRGTAPLNITLERQSEISREARKIMSTYPEVETIVNQIGRPDDGTDPAGYYNSEFFVPLLPQKNWPAVVEQDGWRGRIFGAKRPRTKDELISAINGELDRKLPGVVWNFSQNIRDNVMESLSGVKGDNSIKIIGPDLDRLEVLAARVKNALDGVTGIENVGIFHVRGQSHLEFRPDPDKCKKWGVQVADVNNVVGSALGARAMTTMIEGEKMFDISVRWPKWRRSSETSILDIPLDVVNNQVVLPQGSSFVPNPRGFALPPPPTAATLADTSNPISSTPRLRLRDLVSPVGEDGATDPNGSYERAGASTIYREQGKRLIALKFSVRGRDLAGAVAEAKEKTADLFEAPYRAVWSGEFEEMEDAEARLMIIVPLSLALIFILLYSAFRSFLDSVVVLSNVMALSLGGIWALLLTGTNFSISAAVGFVSIFGVAIMDGLLLISYFNQLRAHGLALHDAIMQGAEKRVRPVMMTALTAILGLLPAALSTRIGSQTQRPLAIVVVGGMITTLFLTRYLMPVLYSFYGHREPPAGAGGLAH